MDVRNLQKVTQIFCFFTVKSQQNDFFPVGVSFRGGIMTTVVVVFIRSNMRIVL